MRLADLTHRNDLTHIADKEDVAALKEAAGIDCNECDSFFVKAEGGRYIDLYGLDGYRLDNMKTIHVHLEDGAPGRI